MVERVDRELEVGPESTFFVRHVEPSPFAGVGTNADARTKEQNDVRLLCLGEQPRSNDAYERGDLLAANSPAVGGFRSSLPTLDPIRTPDCSGTGYLTAAVEAGSVGARDRELCIHIAEACFALVLFNDLEGAFPFDVSGEPCCIRGDNHSYRFYLNELRQPDEAQPSLFATEGAA